MKKVGILSEVSWLWYCGRKSMEKPRFMAGR